MIPSDRILAIAPAAQPYVLQLTTQMNRRGIDRNPTRAATFLGHIHVESRGFRATVENLDYSTEALLKLFSRERISREDAIKFGRNDDHPAHQNALANILYGGEFGREQLGNTQPGDGWRFRGRGLKQLTGRDNYRRFSLWWAGDESVLQDPAILQAPHAAVASAVWFWVTAREKRTGRTLDQIADTGDMRASTLVINGGTNGLNDRIAWFGRYRRSLEG